MAYFEWTASLETGDPDIDEQHRTLFALANQLHDVVEQCETCDNSEMVTDAVYRLTDYVMQHFTDEEALMRRIGYPALGPHRILHEYLTAEVLRLASDYWNGEDILPTRLAPLLADWLREHILAEDMLIVEFERKERT